MRKEILIGGIIAFLLCAGCNKPTNNIAENTSLSEIDRNSENVSLNTELEQWHTESILVNSELEEVSTENFIIDNSSELIESEDTIKNSEIEPSDTDLVWIKEYIPDIYIDLKYATTDNFTQTVIYEDFDAYLRYGTIKKLMQVQEQLKKMGYSLLIWDAYRPVEAQFKLWEICPDAKYVSDPNKGFSKHSRGNTVDITLVTLEGEAIEMPTGFDDFSKKADRDYADVSETAAANSIMLEELMEDAGFKGYSGEWWHYSDIMEYEVVQ